MKVAKSIDELYDEVKDYDLVICNDAALATALNSRVKKPFLGEFAFTPRNLAADLATDILGVPLEDELVLIRKISNETKLDFRYVHGEVEHIKTVRKYTGDVENRLFGKSKKIYGSFRSHATLEKTMELFDGSTNEFYKGKKIAVIGTELFDDLDKCMNPKFGTFDEINILKDEEYKIPEIRALSNNREIAENVVSMINKENADDIALVMDVNGNIAESIKSALYAKDIHFINKLYVKDLNYVRDFIEFISLALSFDILTIKSVREILAVNGGYIPGRYDNYLIHNFDLNTLREIGIKEETVRRTEILVDLMRNIENKKFDQLRDLIVPDKKRGQVKVILDDMGLSDELVTKHKLDELIYAVNNFSDMKHNEQIPDYEKDGVLLVDCCNSVYIDRPVVFYLGMGEEWVPDISVLNNIKYEYIDDVRDINIKKFEILLQQGEVRYYITNRITDGKETIPCEFFSGTECKIVESFSNVCDNYIIGSWVKKEPKKDGTKSGSIEFDNPTKIELNFSPSSYSNYISCPKKYMFGKILDDPESDNSVTGQYIHQYAEFRISYPEKAKEHDTEYYVDKISDLCLGLYRPEERLMEKSILRVCINNINEFADRLDIKPTFSGRKPKKNVFFDNPDIPTSDNTEVDLSNNEAGITGIIDLMHDKTVYDYKSGKNKTAADIQKEMCETKKSDYGKNFQPLFYHYLIRGSEDKSFFSFFFVKGDIKKVVKNDSGNLSSNFVSIGIIHSVDEYFSNIFFKNLIENNYPDLIKYEEKMCKIFIDFGLDKLVWCTEKEFKDKIDVGDKKVWTNICKKVISHLKTVYKDIADYKCFKGYDKSSLFVTDERLNEFIAKVNKDREDCKRFVDDKFPSIPLIDCKNCTFNDICTTVVSEGGEEDF